MDDLDLVSRISELAEEEGRLQGSHGSAGMTDTDRDRLHSVEVALDQCWDLLRQRRARRNVGEDPDSAEVRPEQVVENYQQ